MRKLKTLWKHIPLLFLSVFMLYPILWMFFGSFKANSEVFNVQKILPSRWMLENYINGWNSIPGHVFGDFFMNSFVLVIIITIGTLISVTLTAYPFARMRFKGKKALFVFLMATLLLPMQILLIPRYLLFIALGWTNSTLPLTVPSFFAQVNGTFFIYLLIQFMRGIPISLDESATVDGCGYFRRLVYIILPNCKPALFTIAIFSFIWNWDDFLNQLIYIDSIDKFTVSLALRMFNDNAATINWGELFAMGILTILPCMLIFAFAQKYFVEGITTTGFK